MGATRAIFRRLNYQQRRERLVQQSPVHWGVFKPSVPYRELSLNAAHAASSRSLSPLLPQSFLCLSFRANCLRALVDPEALRDWLDCRDLVCSSGGHCAFRPHLIRRLDASDYFDATDLLGLNESNTLARPCASPLTENVCLNAAGLYHPTG